MNYYTYHTILLVTITLLFVIIIVIKNFYIKHGLPY